jgi:hypothetical protein
VVMHGRGEHITLSLRVITYGNRMPDGYSRNRVSVNSVCGRVAAPELGVLAGRDLGECQGQCRYGQIAIGSASFSWMWTATPSWRATRLVMCSAAVASGGVAPASPPRFTGSSVLLIHTSLTWSPRTAGAKDLSPEGSADVGGGRSDPLAAGARAGRADISPLGTGPKFARGGSSLPLPASGTMTSQPPVKRTWA